MDVLPGFIYETTDGFDELPDELQQLILATARKHMGKERKILVFNPHLSEVFTADDGRLHIPTPGLEGPVIAMLDDYGSIENLREETTFPTINTQFKVRFSLESED